MNTTAITIRRLPLPSRSRWLRRLPDFVALMKPRVMALAVFTALVGMVIAPTHLDPLLEFSAILAIAAGAGAAGVLNMWYDADIDGMINRTAMRSIPRGKVSRTEALAFGLVLAGSSVVALVLVANVEAAGLLAFAILFYVGVYTMWLKRSTPQNIVIGGAAGALPPMIGWAVATGDVGVPMLPVVAGRSATAKQILVYSLLLLPVSILPWALGFTGGLYGAVAAVCGTILAVLAAQVHRHYGINQHASHRLFAFSIFYLFLLFATLLASSANRSTTTLSARVAAPVETSQATFPASKLQTPHGPFRVSAGGV